MLLNSHISAYARCAAEKVCGLVQSTWGTSRGEDELGAIDKILGTKVARRACAGLAPGKHSPWQAPDAAPCVTQGSHFRASVSAPGTFF